MAIFMVYCTWLSICRDSKKASYDLTVMGTSNWQVICSVWLFQIRGSLTKTIGPSLVKTAFSDWQGEIRLLVARASLLWQSHSLIVDSISTVTAMYISGRVVNSLILAGCSGLTQVKTPWGTRASSCLSTSSSTAFTHQVHLEALSGTPSYLKKRICNF